MKRLHGKNVLITDASSPSGKALAEAFAAEGAKLVPGAPRDSGTTDVLVCNDNCVEPFTIAGSTDTQVRKTLDCNAKSAFLATQAVCRHMKDKGGCSIVYLSSIHADKPSGSSFAYSMAKAAVGMLCKETAYDLGRYGIRANVIEMGPVEGDEQLFKSGLTRLYDNLTMKLYKQQLGTWEQAARLAVFLSCGDECPYISGQSIKADGGFLLNYNYRLSYEELENTQAHYSPQTADFFNLGKLQHETGSFAGDLAGKTAVITGSATGVGQGIAVYLAQRGMNVAVTHNRVPADETMDMIRRAGGRAIDVPCNVCDDGSVAALFSAVNDAFGPPDVLINNAMIQPNKWLLEYTPEDFDDVMNVNVLGYVRCIRHALPLLKKSKAGRIINVSSIHSKRPGGFDPVYSMSKAAIQMLTREAAIEASPFGITANALTLGAVKIKPRTSDHNFKPSKQVRLREMPYGFFLSGRGGSVCDAGYIAAFLASGASQYINGSSIRADGGAMLALY